MTIHIRIPDTDLKILNWLSEIDGEIKDIILRDFENLIPEDPNKAIEDLSERINFKLNEIKKFFSFCIRYYLNFYLLGRSKEEYINLIEKSIISSDINLDFNEELVDILTRILSMENSIGILAKTIALLRENPSNFFNAKIITDLRNIYFTDKPELTNYALVIHSLRITVLEENEKKTRQISLKSSDLINLRDVINRALEKDKNLIKTCDDKEIKIIKDIDIFI